MGNRVSKRREGTYDVIEERPACQKRHHVRLRRSKRSIAVDPDSKIDIAPPEREKHYIDHGYRECGEANNLLYENVNDPLLNRTSEDACERGENIYEVFTSHLFNFDGPGNAEKTIRDESQRPHESLKAGDDSALFYECTNETFLPSITKRKLPLIRERMANAGEVSNQTGQMLQGCESFVEGCACGHWPCGTETSNKPFFDGNQNNADQGRQKRCYLVDRRELENMHNPSARVAPLGGNHQGVHSHQEDPAKKKEEEEEEVVVVVEEEKRKEEKKKMEEVEEDGARSQEYQMKEEDLMERNMMEDEPAKQDTREKNMHWNFWVSTHRIHVFLDGQDRRVISIGRLSGCDIELTNVTRLSVCGEEEYKVIIKGADYIQISKCKYMFMDKFPDFRVNSGALERDSIH